MILTSDVDWDPSVLHHSLDDTDEWFDAQTDLPPAIVQNPFDEFGEYRNITVAKQRSWTPRQPIVWKTTLTTVF